MCIVEVGEVEERMSELTASLEAPQSAESVTDGWKEAKLDDATSESVHCEDHADLARVQTKASRELKRQVRILFIVRLPWKVQERGQYLVECHGVER